MRTSRGKRWEVDRVFRKGWGLERQEGMLESWDHKGSSHSSLRIRSHSWCGKGEGRRCYVSEMPEILKPLQNHRHEEPKDLNSPALHMYTLFNKKTEALWGQASTSKAHMATAQRYRSRPSLPVLCFLNPVQHLWAPRRDSLTEEVARVKKKTRKTKKKKCQEAQETLPSNNR